MITTLPTAADSTEYRWPFEVQGGRFQLRRVDLRAEAARERRDELAAQAEWALGELLNENLDQQLLDLVRAQVAVDQAQPNEPAKREAIEGWSAKSRRNLLRTVAGLNMAGHWAMLTLTLPGWWLELCATPADLKAARKAFRRRWEREYGTWSALWKLEFQHRGAPHFHVGVGLPEGVSARELTEWASRTWHEVLCHPASNRYHQKCPGPVCEHADHLVHGAQLDCQYSRRLRSAGSAFAGYFAKHGVWESKEYQHNRPGWRMRGFAGVLDVMAGPGAGDQLRAAAEEWDHPGRWWGYENVEAARLVEGEMTPDEVECARLLARKVVARRSWRYLEIEGRTVLVRRSLASLHPHRFEDGRLRDPAGFWLLMANPSEFRHWFLSTVRQLVEVPRGIERARFLATVEEPGARPCPGRRQPMRTGGRDASRPPDRTAATELDGAPA